MKSHDGLLLLRRGDDLEGLSYGLAVQTQGIDQLKVLSFKSSSFLSLFVFLLILDF